MYSKKDIMTGVVTYQPQIERFVQCIEAIQGQTDKVVVYDNGSKNIEEIASILKSICSNYELIRNEYNAGIATALAEIMEYAEKNGYSWVLSMDQDSLLQVGTISIYLQEVNMLSDAGMVTCLIKDRNFVDKKYENQNEKRREVEYCITSGALTSVSAYKKTSGYDKSFFIDCVDFDICYSLREKGFKIYRVNYLGLLHEVGKGENRYFLWKTIVVYHEHPTRIYYLARNTVRLYKKHKDYGILMLVKKELTQFIKIVLYEDKKMQKLRMFWYGLTEHSIQQIKQMEKNL